MKNQKIKKSDVKPRIKKLVFIGVAIVLLATVVALIEHKKDYRNKLIYSYASVYMKSNSEQEKQQYAAKVQQLLESNGVALTSSAHIPTGLINIGPYISACWGWAQSATENPYTEWVWESDAFSYCMQNPSIAWH